MFGREETGVTAATENERDRSLRSLLESVRSIAVIGIKAGEGDDAYRVPRYMQAQGYRIVPISPKLDGVLGERVYGSLAQVAGPVDLVNVFRAPQHVPAHVDEILALAVAPRGVWLQLGIRSDDAAKRLEDRGITVVQDACLMVEHGRLLGSERA